MRNDCGLTDCHGDPAPLRYEFYQVATIYYCIELQRTTAFYSLGVYVSMVCACSLSQCCCYLVIDRTWKTKWPILLLLKYTVLENSLEKVKPEKIDVYKKKYLKKINNNKKKLLPRK